MRPSVLSTFFWFMIAKTILASGSVQSMYLYNFDKQKEKQLIRILQNTVEVYKVTKEKEPLILMYRLPIGFPIQTSFILKFQNTVHLFVITKPYKVIEIYYDTLLNKIVQTYPQQLQQPEQIVNNSKMHYYAVNDHDYKRAFIYCQKFQIIVQVNTDNDKYSTNHAIQSAVPNNLLYNTNNILQMEFVQNSIYILFKNLLNQLYIYKFPLGEDKNSQSVAQEQQYEHPLQIQDHISRFMILQGDVILLLGAKISILLNYATKQQYQLVFQLSDVSTILPTPWGAVVADFSRKLYGLTCSNSQINNISSINALECQCFLITQIPTLANTLINVNGNLMCGSKDGDSILLDFQAETMPQLNSNGQMLTKINVLQTIPHIGPIHCLLNSENDIFIAAGDEIKSQLCKISSLCQLQENIISQFNGKYKIARVVDGIYALINQLQTQIHIIKLDNNTFTHTDTLNTIFLYQQISKSNSDQNNQTEQMQSKYQIPQIYIVKNTCILHSFDVLFVYKVISEHLVKSQEILLKDYVEANKEVQIVVTDSLLQILSGYKLALFKIESGEVQYLKTINLNDWEIIKQNINQTDAYTNIDENQQIFNFYTNSRTTNEIIKYKLNDQQGMLCYQQYNDPVVKCLDLVHNKIKNINLIQKSETYPAAIKDIMFLREYLIFLDGFNLLYKYNLEDETIHIIQLTINDCEEQKIIQISQDFILIQNHLIYLQTMKITLVRYFDNNQTLYSSNENIQTSQLIYSYCLDHSMSLFLYTSTDGKLYCANLDIFIKQNLQIDSLCNSSLINGIWMMQGLIYASNNYLSDDPSNNHQTTTKYIVNSKTHSLQIFRQTQAYPQMSTRVQILSSHLKNISSIKIASNYIVTKVITHIYMDDLYVLILVTTQEEQGFLLIYMLGQNKFVSNKEEKDLKVDQQSKIVNDQNDNNMNVKEEEIQIDINEVQNLTNQHKPLKHQYQLVQQIRYSKAAFDMCINNKLLYVASLNQVHIYQFNKNIEQDEEQMEKDPEVITEINNCSYNLLILQIIVQNQVIYTLDVFKGLVVFEYDEKMNNIKLPKAFPIKSPTCFTINEGDILIATSEAQLLIIQEIHHRFCIKQQIYTGESISALCLTNKLYNRYIAGTLSGKIFQFVLESTDNMNHLWKILKNSFHTSNMMQYDDELYQYQNGNTVSKFIDFDHLKALQQYSEQLMLENNDMQIIQNTIDKFQ